MNPTVHSNLEQIILTFLKSTREVTVNELGIKKKISDSTLYRTLKKLEGQGRVKCRYLRSTHSQRYVKHFRMIEMVVK